MNTKNINDKTLAVKIGLVCGVIAAIIIMGAVKLSSVLLGLLAIIPSCFILCSLIIILSPQPKINKTMILVPKKGAAEQRKRNIKMGWQLLIGYGLIAAFFWFAAFYHSSILFSIIAIPFTLIALAGLIFLFSKESKELVKKDDTFESNSTPSKL